MESNNSDVEENGGCAVGDSCEDLAIICALNDEEFHLEVIESEISAGDSQPFSEDKEGSDDIV